MQLIKVISSLLFISSVRSVNPEDKKEKTVTVTTESDKNNSGESTSKTATLTTSESTARFRFETEIKDNNTKDATIMLTTTQKDFVLADVDNFKMELIENKKEETSTKTLKSPADYTETTDDKGKKDFPLTLTNSTIKNEFSDARVIKISYTTKDSNDKKTYFVGLSDTAFKVEADGDKFKITEVTRDPGLNWNTVSSSKDSDKPWYRRPWVWLTFSIIVVLFIGLVVYAATKNNN